MLRLRWLVLGALAGIGGRWWALRRAKDLGRRVTPGAQVRVDRYRR